MKKMIAAILLIAAVANANLTPSNGVLPPQSGQSGKFLSTNGSVASWQTGGGGGGGADTDLGNLTSPTNINKSFLFDIDGTHDIGASGDNRPQHVFVSDYVSVGHYPLGASTPGAALVNGSAPGLHFFNGGLDQYDVVASAASGVSIENFGASVAIFNVQNSKFSFEDKSNPTAGDFYFQGDSSTGVTIGRNLTLYGEQSDGTAVQLIGVDGSDASVIFGGGGGTVIENLTAGQLYRDDGSLSLDWLGSELYFPDNNVAVDYSADDELILSASHTNYSTNNGSNHPAVSACGSGATITAYTSGPGGIPATDTTGVVNVGTGVITSCTVTFFTQWGGNINPYAPHCFLNMQANTVLLYSATTTSTTLTMTFSATADGKSIDYFCVGNK